MGLCSHCVGDSDIIYIDDNGGKFCVECGVKRCEEIENAKKADSITDEFDSNSISDGDSGLQRNAGC